MIDYNGPAFLPTSGAAKVLGIGASTCRKWVAEGLLPHVKSGNKAFINMAATLEMLDKASRENGALDGKAVGA